MSQGYGNTMIAVVLIVGLSVGLGVGYFLPGLFAVPPEEVPDDYAIIMNRGTINVGTNSGWPPFEMVNTTTNELEGFDIDLAEYVAADMGVTVNWIDMDFDALIAACEGGTIDMIASATFITRARAEVLQPLVWYIRTNEVIVVKASNNLSITDLAQLDGKNGGVQTGTTEDEELSVIAGVNDTLTRYTLVETMFADLNTGTLDYVFVDEPIVALYGSVYSIKIIFTVPAPPTAFYIRYGSDDLSAAINSAIAEGFADGTIDAMIAKWFG
ncbi:MAG: transporter substrate-binding domain-containing protein [Candidatus Thorarchaeota archaeon]